MNYAVPSMMLITEFDTYFIYIPTNIKIRMSLVFLNLTQKWGQNIHN